MAKKFLCSVADVWAYDASDVLLFEGNTLMDSSLSNALSNTDVRGGKGNTLQYVFYHSADLTGTITNIQWSMEQLALSIGSTITTGSNLFTTETVALTAGVGTIAGTPIAFNSTTKYAWVTYGTVVSERVAVDGSKQFTIADTSYTGNVCVRYYNYNANVRSMTITADMIPAIFTLVMKAGLYETDDLTSTTSQVGEVVFTIDRAQATGAFDISMTADGVASTPLNFRALTSTSTAAGCATGVKQYGTIQEYIYDYNWYDDVVALAVYGGNFELAQSESVLPIYYAVTSAGTSFVPLYSALTFAATGGTTVDNTNAATRGTITGGGSGGTVVVTITAKTSVELTIAVTLAT
jgi:hypothetical protein